MIKLFLHPRNTPEYKTIFLYMGQNTFLKKKVTNHYIFV